MDGNLLDGLPPLASDGEALEDILALPGTRIERIVSTGQSSSPGLWYDQPIAEWVLLVAGAARLRFEDEHDARTLKPGDHVFIAPHRRHRVEATDPSMHTVWLAVWIGDVPSASA